MSSEAVGVTAAVVTLMILVYAQTKPAVNKWATIRYLRCRYEFDLDIFLTPGEARGLSLMERLRRALRTALRFIAWALIPRAGRTRLDTLLSQLYRESRRPRHLPPTDGCDPSVAEALFVSKDLREYRQDRARIRVHKKVRCAGGCDTRFGKRRRDHDFWGGEGIYGGWLCPTTPCRDQPTGDHYCGMCLNELRQLSQVPQLADTQVHLVDLDPHPEHPDLQDY